MGVGLFVGSTMDYDSIEVPIASAAFTVLLELDVNIAISGEGICAVVGL